MASKRVYGGILVGIAAAFGGILYWTIQGLSTRNNVLGCIATTPGCQQIATGLSSSHVAVGFLSAVFSLGVYFLIFAKDTTHQLVKEQSAMQKREEQIELLERVMTPGERAIFSAVAKEDGVLQTSLRYRTNLTPGRISQVLADFEKQGLVSRKPEGKSYRIHLTM